MIKTASDIMTRNVICAGPQESVNNLINTFLDHRISSAPVVDENGALIGVVTKTDILAHIVHLDLDLTLKVALKDVLGARADSSAPNCPPEQPVRTSTSPSPVSTATTRSGDGRDGIAGFPASNPVMDVTINDDCRANRAGLAWD